MGKTNSDFVETVSSSRQVIFAENYCSMIEINKEDYFGVADALKDAIGDREFFTGKVEYGCERFFSTLSATVLVYRDGRGCEYLGEIVKLVPVWWQFDTTLPDGSVGVNDFGFSEMADCFLSSL